MSNIPWLKVAMIVFAVTLAISAVWAYNSMAEDLKTSEQNNAKLQDALSVQGDLIQQQQMDFFEIQTAMDEVAHQNRELRQQFSDLQQLFQKHDLGNLAERKPGLIENRINRAVQEISDCLTQITGTENADMVDCN